MMVYLIVLRLLHIVGGIFWAGTTFFAVGFMEPAVKEAGQGGQQFMRTLTQRTPFTLVMSVAALASTLSGILLYLYSSGGFRSNWMFTGSGLAFGIGSLTGIAAAVIGFTINRAAAANMGKLGAQITAAGGPPTPEQMALMEGYQHTLARATVWTATLLAITVVLMSGARYIRF